MDSSVCSGGRVYIGLYHWTQTMIRITQVHESIAAIFNSRKKEKKTPSQNPFFYIYILPTHLAGKLVLAHNRELKHNMLARQLLIDLAERIDLIVDASALLRVQEDLDDFMAVLFGADALADDLGRVHEVGQDRVVHGRQGARARALLRDAAAARGEWEDAALCNEQDVAVGELLFELACEAGGWDVLVWRFVEGGGGGRTDRCWTLRKPPRRGTGTKTTMAFLPWPTSSCGRQEELAFPYRPSFPRGEAGEHRLKGRLGDPSTGRGSYYLLGGRELQRLQSTLEVGDRLL